MSGILGEVRKNVLFGVSGRENRVSGTGSESKKVVSGDGWRGKG